MALLSAAAHLAGRLGVKFEAGTVDHGLRPESAREVELVARRTAALGLVHHRVSAPVARSAGLEAAARAARYAALEGLRQSRGLGHVATGHTASDQAETVLMRLARGASLAGVAGIQAARTDRVIRPLLFASRQDVERYVAAQGITAARDPMNADPQFLRVRIRQAVIPALEGAAGPGVEQAVARFAAFAAEDEVWLSDEARRALTLVRWAEDDSLEAEALCALGPPIARRVLALWLAAQGVELDSTVLEAALGAARHRARTPLPGDRLLAWTNGRVEVVQAPARHRRTSS